MTSGHRAAAQRPPSRRLLSALAGAAAALTVAGCAGASSAGPSPSPATGATTSPSATAAPTAAPTAGTSPGGSAGSSLGASAGPGSPGPATPSSTSSVPQCRTADLRATLSGGDGAAGTIYYRLRLTNAGAHPCALGGYSGVSFVDGSGQQVGASAQRDAGAGRPRLLELAPGQTAQARLGVAEAGNYDAAQCRPVTVGGLRVYPPNQTASLIVRHRFDACADQDVQLLTIEPYRSRG